MISNRLKRTISTSGGLELLQMVSEAIPSSVLVRMLSPQGDGL